MTQRSKKMNRDLERGQQMEFTESVGHKAEQDSIGSKAKINPDIVIDSQGTGERERKFKQRGHSKRKSSKKKVEPESSLECADPEAPKRPPRTNRKKKVEKNKEESFVTENDGTQNDGTFLRIRKSQEYRALLTSSKESQDLHELNSALLYPHCNQSLSDTGYHSSQDKSHKLSSQKKYRSEFQSNNKFEQTSNDISCDNSDKEEDYFEEGLSGTNGNGAVKKQHTKTAHGKDPFLNSYDSLGLSQELNLGQTFSVSSKPPIYAKTRSVTNLAKSQELKKCEILTNSLDNQHTTKGTLQDNISFKTNSKNRLILDLQGEKRVNDQLGQEGQIQLSKYLIKSKERKLGNEKSIQHRLCEVSANFESSKSQENSYTHLNSNSQQVPRSLSLTAGLDAISRKHLGFEADLGTRGSRKVAKSPRRRDRRVYCEGYSDTESSVTDTGDEAYPEFYRSRESSFVRSLSFCVSRKKKTKQKSNQNSPSLLRKSKDLIASPAGTIETRNRSRSSRKKTSSRETSPFSQDSVVSSDKEQQRPRSLERIAKRLLSPSSRRRRRVQPQDILKAKSQEHHPSTSEYSCSDTESHPDVPFSSYHSQSALKTNLFITNNTQTNAKINTECSNDLLVPYNSKPQRLNTTQNLSHTHSHLSSSEDVSKPRVSLQTTTEEITSAADFNLTHDSSISNSGNKTQLDNVKHELNKGRKAQNARREKSKTVQVFLDYNDNGVKSEPNSARGKSGPEDLIAKYLGTPERDSPNLSNKLRLNRRCVSDLGFDRPDLDLQGLADTWSTMESTSLTPRTAALLNNPAFKKHLTKMRVHESLDKSLKSMRSLPVTPRHTQSLATSPQHSPQMSRKLFPGGVPDSLSGYSQGLNDSNFETLHIKLNQMVDNGGVVNGLGNRHRVFSSHQDLRVNSEERQESVSPRPSVIKKCVSTSDVQMSSSVSHQKISRSKFHIPSFNEFKTTKKMGKISEEEGTWTDSLGNVLLNSSHGDAYELRSQRNNKVITRGGSEESCRDASHEEQRTRHSSLGDVGESVRSVIEDFDNTIDQFLCDSSPKLGTNLSKTKDKPTFYFGESSPQPTRGSSRNGSQYGHHLSAYDDADTSVFDGGGDTERQMHKSESDSFQGNVRGSTPEVTSDLDMEDQLKTPININPEKWPLPQDGAPISRSTSDVSDIKEEEKRKAGVREKRTKPYKSEPFGSDRPNEYQTETPGKKHHTKANHMKRQNSKEDILNFLANNSGSSGASSTMSLESCFEEESDLEQNQQDSNALVKLSTGSTSQESDVEPADEFQPLNSNATIDPKTGPQCGDCEKVIEGPKIPVQFADSKALCDKCKAKRRERQDIIQEIVTSESNFGKDLKIMKKEFYEQMKSSNLLNAEQLQTVFINLDELIAVNERFLSQLEQALQYAKDRNDTSYSNVNIGKLFIESSNMLLVYESYCINQSAAPVLLEQLEREKELLKIFLQVAQNDNQALRRMHLKSFLVLPVQRIMKYPLLLNRLHKATRLHHPDKEAIKRAQTKIESILELINSKTKGTAGMKLRRRMSSTNLMKHQKSIDDLEINRSALEIMGWNNNETSFIQTGKLQFTQPTDHLWVKKGKMLKFTTANALILTLGYGNSEDCEPTSNKLLFPKATSIREAVLVLIKEKAGKYISIREPFHLDKCVISQDAECSEVFEVLEQGKDAFLFKAEDEKETKNWLQKLKQHTKDLGKWRMRRNALANIMIHTS